MRERDFSEDLYDVDKNQCGVVLELDAGTYEITSDGQTITVKMLLVPRDLKENEVVINSR